MGQFIFTSFYDMVMNVDLSKCSDDKYINDISNGTLLFLFWEYMRGGFFPHFRLLDSSKAGPVSNNSFMIRPSFDPLLLRSLNTACRNGKFHFINFNSFNDKCTFSSLPTSDCFPLSRPSIWNESIQSDKLVHIRIVHVLAAGLTCWSFLPADTLSLYKK